MSQYDEEILRRVRELGKQQKNITKVIDIVDPKEGEEFSEDIQNEEHPLCIMYQSGLKSDLTPIRWDLLEIQKESDQLELNGKRNAAKMIDEFLGNENSAATE